MLFNNIFNIIEISNFAFIMIVFLSYKWEDKKHADDLKSYLRNPNNMYRHIPLTERDDYREKGKKYVREYLRDIIRNCEALLCLIGKNTHSSPWVSYEIDVANSQSKKIVPVRIPNTDGGPPKLIKDRKIEIVEWNSIVINDALSKN